jgi:cAMP-specific phosphodiesterase 4
MDGPSPKACADRMMFLKMMIKAADVSNPCKATDLYLFWTNNILEEFYHQGDLEREAGLPVTKMPNCDRTTPSLAQGQIGFLCFVVKPLMDAILVFLNDQVRPSLDILSHVCYRFSFFFFHFLHRPLISNMLIA